MDETEPPSIIVCCPDASTVERVSALVEGRLRGGYRVDVRAEDADGIAATVLRTRANDGGRPLGMVAMDEANALLAIEAGADCAIAKELLDDRGILGFFDRILLRAKLRKEQETLQADFIHQEKLAALGTLVAGVAHEINNPLTALLLSAERLKSSAGSSENEALVAEVMGAADAIASVVRDLTMFARQGDDEDTTVVDLNVLLGQVVRMVGRRVRAHALVELDCSTEPALVMASSSRLTQVFMNLLLNAAHAVAEVPRPAHRVRISVRADEHAVAVSFADTGPGIAPHLSEKVFDPFFTTKRAGTGTGLGLSISRTILRRLGGDLLLESVHGEGATFVALIPAADPSELPESARVTSSHSLQSKQPRRRVLVVDADERVLRGIARGLELDYDILLARDAVEGLTLLDSGSHADAVVADAAAPERSGVELQDALRQRGAELAASMVFLVNADETADTVGLAERGLVLTKPVNRAMLLGAVSKALDNGVNALSPSPRR